MSRPLDNAGRIVMGPAPLPPRTALTSRNEMEEEETVGDVEMQQEDESKFPLPQQEYCCLTSPHVGPIQVVRFSHGHGDYLLSGGSDRTIQLWNPTKSKHIKEFKGPHGREVMDIAITHSNEKFASGGGDRTVFLWDISTAQVIRRLRGHDARVNGLAFNDDDGVLASCGDDQSCRLWDVRSFARDPIQTLTQAKDSVSSVKIAGTEIITSSMDGCVRRYDIRTAQIITDHIGAPVSSVSLTNDKNCLLLSCLDSTYRLLDKSNGELLNEYVGATAKEIKMECVVDNGDAFAIGGSENGEILAWDLVETAISHRYAAHQGAVTSIAWHPKLKCFASASVDGSIRYWK